MAGTLRLGCVSIALVGVVYGKSGFGQPSVIGASATCASIEFSYAGDETGDSLSTAYVFAKHPNDPDFGQWGKAMPLLKTDVTDPTGQHLTKYHGLMRGLPVGAEFEVKVAGDSNMMHADASPKSSAASTLREIALPEAPSNMEVHRTDLRVNKPKHDGSVCVDLEWSHQHQKLTRQPGDVYFRVLYQYKGEEAIQYCEDEVGSLHHTCGEPLASVTSSLPSSFTTICGLRPQRWIRFVVQAFSCDSQAAMPTDGGANQTGVCSRHVDVVLPPSAPSVITTLVTQPANQESVAGFHPKAILDWIPQPGESIAGHAIYLELVDVSAIKLLCWVPQDGSKYAKGHLEMPIKRKNHTHAKDTLLLQDYLAHFHVHHEQQLLVSTRTFGRLESPTYSFRLGDWLVMEDAVKCLSSFEAKYPSYVSQPRVLAWTQQEALSLYD